MKFKEPIDEQPIRIIETNHVCDNLQAFALWLELDYNKCLQDLQQQNGRNHIIVQGWHIEPAAGGTTGRRKKAVRITSISSGISDEYPSLYEASVVLGLSLGELYLAVHNKGAYALSFNVEYI
jgi:hypothetical protein